MRSKCTHNHYILRNIYSKYYPDHYTRTKLEKVLAITPKDIHYFIYIIYYS